MDRLKGPGAASAPTLDDGNVSGAVRSIVPHAVLAIVFTAVVNILFLASPIYMMQLYGRVLDSRSIETLISLSIVLALVLAAMAAADAARARLLARAGARIARRLTGPATGIAIRSGKGRVATTLEELELVRRFFANGSAATLMDTPFTILFLFVLFLLHPALGLVATLGALVILATVALPRIVEGARERRIADGSRAAVELSTVLGRDRGELRALGLSEGLAARLSADQLTVGGTRLLSAETAASTGALARLWRLAAHSAALATGAVLAIDGALAPAAMLAAAILTGRALGPLEAVPVALRHGRLARRTLAGLSDAIGSEGVSVTSGRPKPTCGVLVEARRLVATPDGASRPALRSLNFTIQPGTVVSVIGETGAGKSTLLRCLSGAEPIRNGEVRVGSLDVAAADRGHLSDLVGWLPQDPELYPGTVADNIARFLPSREEDALRAAGRAGIVDAINRLPRGFGTDVSAPAIAASPTLRQRIAFARALFGDPGLVLLDQPTSHADAAGEVATLNAIRRLKEAGVTVIVVSHKPVMATVADRIMLLADGLIDVFEDRETVLDAVRRRSLKAVQPHTTAGGVPRAVPLDNRKEA
jgi:PrtD family type I secretion system ABC transporter